MDQQNDDAENKPPATLEHTDSKESFRQLWWTIGVTAVGMILAAYFYL